MWQPVNPRSLLASYLEDEELLKKVQANELKKILTPFLIQAVVGVFLVVFILLFLSSHEDALSYQQSDTPRIFLLILICGYLLIGLPIIAFTTVRKRKLFCATCLQKLDVARIEGGSMTEVFYICHSCQKYKVEFDRTESST